MTGGSYEKYTVGITMFVNANGELGLYENGLRQNVYFLYRLFKASPRCERVVLLNHGDGEPTKPLPGLDLPLKEIVRSHKVKQKLDYVIVVGAAVDRDTILRWRKDGTRIICYKGGNGAVISMEALIAQPPRADAERYFDADYFDAIWMTPQHIHTYRSYCEVLYRCPVYEVPQVWLPTFLNIRLKELANPFGYQAKSGKKRVGVLDPNITVMKTSHLPMLVCDAGYRLRPDLFSAIYITNAIQLQQNAHFNSFALRMHAVKDKIMTVEPRFVTADFLANHADAVVTHHWENGLNYLYYDVLYGGYPLIHNSHFLKNYGYYYPSFNAEEGGKVLVDALERHNDELPKYRENCAALLAEIDATSPGRIAIHEDMLARVSAQARR